MACLILRNETMTSKRIAQTNQQQKSEASQASGILQRAAVRSVSDAEVQSTEDKEAQPLSDSAFSKDFSRVPISTTKPQPIMAKLMIGAVGDKYEQEADRVASEIVSRINTPTFVLPGQGKAVQREVIQIQDDEAKLMRSPIVQRMPSKEKSYKIPEGFNENDPEVQRLLEELHNETISKEEWGKILKIVNPSEKTLQSLITLVNSILEHGILSQKVAQEKRISIVGSVDKVSKNADQKIPIAVNNLTLVSENLDEAKNVALDSLTAENRGSISVSLERQDDFLLRYFPKESDMVLNQNEQQTLEQDSSNAPELRSQIEKHLKAQKAARQITTKLNNGEFNKVLSERAQNTVLAILNKNVISKSGATNIQEGTTIEALNNTSQELGVVADQITPKQIISLLVPNILTNIKYQKEIKNPNNVNIKYVDSKSINAFYKPADGKSNIEVAVQAPDYQEAIAQELLKQRVIATHIATASVKSDEDKTVQGEDTETKDNEARLMRSPILQRKSSDGGIAATPNLEASINRARSGGQVIADNIREPMEVAFGADFSGVKVHTDGQSDQLNRSIQARAFTTGQDVFFRQGEYNPGSRGGQELLAHELTHVVQQSKGTVQGERRRTNHHDHQESIYRRSPGSLVSQIQLTTTASDMTHLEILDLSYCEKPTSGRSGNLVLLDKSFVYKLFKNDGEYLREMKDSVELMNTGAPVLFYKGLDKRKVILPDKEQLTIAVLMMYRMQGQTFMLAKTGGIRRFTNIVDKYKDNPVQLKNLQRWFKAASDAGIKDAQFIYDSTTNQLYFMDVHLGGTRGGGDCQEIVNYINNLL
jgi:hypothetical protein